MRATYCLQKAGAAACVGKTGRLHAYELVNEPAALHRAAEGRPEARADQ
jgi:hypothetical protein